MNEGVGAADGAVELERAAEADGEGEQVRRNRLRHLEGLDREIIALHTELARTVSAGLGLLIAVPPVLARARA